MLNLCEKVANFVEFVRKIAKNIGIGYRVDIFIGFFGYRYRYRLSGSNIGIGIEYRGQLSVSVSSIGYRDFFNIERL